MSQQDSNQTPESQSSVAQSQTKSANVTLAKILNVLSLLWQKFLPLWNKLLAFTRTRLSPEWNEKLGDQALSGILAGAILILFWFTSSLFSPAPQPRVANRPPLILPKEPMKSFPTDLSAPEAAPEVVTAPAIDSEPIESSEPVVESTLDPNLTPEQRRIAAIEAQVIEISDRFISGLVLGVEQNEAQEQMKVTVSNDWYRFNAEQQDRFANELWTRSQTFKLPNLEIRDPKGVLVARPPIVGDSMIVVKRKVVNI